MEPSTMLSSSARPLPSTSLLVGPSPQASFLSKTLAPQTPLSRTVRSRTSAVPPVRAVAVSESAAAAAVPGVERKECPPELKAAIEDRLRNCLTHTDLEKHIPELKNKRQGKVRDTYEVGDNENLVAVTTDRQSAFDRVLASVPFKGQVLNQTAAWWFERTANIVRNAAVAVPDPNVTIFRKCEVFPIEFVVRGYITGTTSTSLWTVYQKGIRNYCGNPLKEGMVKNEKLAFNILTPTTKAEDHDEPITADEIVARGLMTREDFKYCKKKALELFAFGQAVAFENGLLLVDTKYEFGKDQAGHIRLIDEIHTPDSSRYWIASSYEQRMKDGLEPENIDKEFLRLWFRDNCDPYNDEVLPAAPVELITELSWRYIKLYEAITGQPFDVAAAEPGKDIGDRIEHNLKRVW